MPHRHWQPQLSPARSLPWPITTMALLVEMPVAAAAAADPLPLAIPLDRGLPPPSAMTVKVGIEPPAAAAEPEPLACSLLDCFGCVDERILTLDEELDEEL